jgi:penicillin-binding protein 1C
VLKQYLRLVPFGQNTHGIEEAAVWYFDRPAQDLSWAQIAFLAAIPQSPSFYNPAHAAGFLRATARARLALARLREQGVMDQVDYEEALDDLAALTVKPHPARRPDALHAILQIAALARQGTPAAQIHSTIDLGLQAEVTKIAAGGIAAGRRAADGRAGRGPAKHGGAGAGRFAAILCARCWRN